MIVRDEASVISRCLQSVLPFIDTWTIVDTGSIDHTPDVIFDTLTGVSGTLCRRPWRDFASNRTEALSLARDRADFSLIIDADDVIVLPTDFADLDLSLDCYHFDIIDPPTRYERIQLVSNRLNWRYRGVVHEFITCDTHHRQGKLPIKIVRNHDGARRKNPDRFMLDAELIENAIPLERDPLLRSRYHFYLAQSYRDAGCFPQALEWYLKRSTLGGWKEEVFYSLYQAAVMMEMLDYPEDVVLEAYRTAHEATETRIEAAHAASRYCRVRQRYQEGYEIARAALGRQEPVDGLFCEPWIYSVGLLDEYSVNAFHTGRYRECLDACNELIETGHIEGEVLGRVECNALAAMDFL